MIYYEFSNKMYVEANKTHDLFLGVKTNRARFKSFRQRILKSESLMCQYHKNKSIYAFSADLKTCDEENYFNLLIPYAN